MVKESAAFTAGHQARRMGSSSSKDLNSLMAFSEEVLKALGGRGRRVCDKLVHDSRIGWHQGEVSGIINLLVSTGQGLCSCSQQFPSGRGQLPIKTT